VKADPGQVEQVILNLAVNARDAMPRGAGSRSRPPTSRWMGYARLHAPVNQATIRSGNFRTRASACTVNPVPLFERSSRQRTKGTAWDSPRLRIVKQSGGYIWVYAASRGTSFKIYCRTHRRGVASSSTGGGGPPGGGGTPEETF